jgi:drug/metabolite transporter (DMT)-like permease
MIARFRSSVLMLMLAHVSITGCGYVIVKLGLGEFDPLPFAFWRFVTGLAALGIIVLVLRCWPKIEKGDWPRVIALALLAVPVNQLVYLIGMRWTVPSHASLLYGATAAFALLMSAAAGYEKLRVYKFVAIALALAGLAIVMLQPGTSVLDHEHLFGDILVFCAVIFWAGYTVVAKPIVKKYGALPLTTFCLILGTLMVLPFVVPAALAADYSRVTKIGVFAVIYSGVMLTAVAYTIWFALVKLIDPSQVAILTAPQPIVATTISSIVIGEVIGLPLVLGGVLVIGGVVMMDLPAFIERRSNRKLNSSGNGNGS